MLIKGLGLEDARKFYAGNGGQLNPDWVEILMGFPIGWTDVECDEPEPWPGWPAPMGVSTGLWPTPNCMDMLPPRVGDEREKSLTWDGRTRRQKSGNLREEVCSERVKTWPTPVANDDNKSPEAHMAMKSRMKGGPRNSITSLQVMMKTEEVNEFGQFPYEPPRTCAKMPNRAKRLKALGNSNPPQQYVPALMFIETMRRMMVCGKS